MRITVLLKGVPDTYEPRSLATETGLTDRTTGEVVLDEIGERALEVALAYADAHPGTEVTALSMSPQATGAVLRRALAMGADSAMHVVDEALRGADLGLTAEVLTAAIRHSPADLVIAGAASSDGAAGVLPAMLSEHLQLPLLSNLSSVDIGERSVAGARLIEAGETHLAAALPSVISITEALPEARYPDFKGVMAAKKKPYTMMGCAQLGVEVREDDTPRSIMISVAEKPPRERGTRIIDDGDAGKRLADFLLRNGLVEQSR